MSSPARTVAENRVGNSTAPAGMTSLCGPNLKTEPHLVIGSETYVTSPICALLRLSATTLRVVLAVPRSPSVEPIRPSIRLCWVVGPVRSPRPSLRSQALTPLRTASISAYRTRRVGFIASSQGLLGKGSVRESLPSPKAIEGPQFYNPLTLTITTSYKRKGARSEDRTPVTKRCNCNDKM